MLVWIWTGWGILALVFWFMSHLIIQLIVDNAIAPGYYLANPWPKILASAISGALIWFVGRALNRGNISERRHLLDARHTLFFIPMEYWGPLFFGIGLATALL